MRLVFLFDQKVVAWHWQWPWCARRQRTSRKSVEVFFQRNLPSLCLRKGACGPALHLAAPLSLSVLSLTGQTAGHVGQHLARRLRANPRIAAGQV